MSNRYTHNKNEGSRGAFNPRKQQFVPKNPNSSAQKLSDSLRHSDSGAVASSAIAGNRLTRKDGASVPNQTRSGNFVKYLPHDEAVASGLAADEGGLDPIESQRVVDLLNRELSRLLKLNPREFWKEGCCKCIAFIFWWFVVLNVWLITDVNFQVCRVVLTILS